MFYDSLVLFCLPLGHRRVLLKIKLWFPVYLQMWVALGVRVTRSWVKPLSRKIYMLLNS